MTKILRLPRVVEKTGLSRSTIYSKMSKSEFPQRISLGANSIGWLESEVEQWIASKVIGDRLIYGKVKSLESLPLFEPLTAGIQKN